MASAGADERRGVFREEPIKRLQNLETKHHSAGMFKAGGVTWTCLHL